MKLLCQYTIRSYDYYSSSCCNYYCYSCYTILCNIGMCGAQLQSAVLSVDASFLIVALWSFFTFSAQDQSRFASFGAWCEKIMKTPSKPCSSKRWLPLMNKLTWYSFFRGLSCFTYFGDVWGICPAKKQGSCFSGKSSCFSCKWTTSIKFQQYTNIHQYSSYLHVILFSLIGSCSSRSISPILYNTRIANSAQGFEIDFWFILFKVTDGLYGGLWIT